MVPTVPWLIRMDNPGTGFEWGGSQLPLIITALLGDSPQTLVTVLNGPTSSNYNKPHRGQAPNSQSWLNQGTSTVQYSTKPNSSHTQL